MSGALDVVFLDIDGVLLPLDEGWGPTCPECHNGPDTSPPLWSCDRCGEHHRDNCSNAVSTMPNGDQLCRSCADATPNSSSKRPRRAIQPQPQPAADREDSAPDGPKGLLFPRETLEALDWLVGRTGAELVLSSTWRVRQEWTENILDCFEEFGGRLARVRKFRRTPQADGVRQWEIGAWLAANPGLRAWLAVDDLDLVGGRLNVRHSSLFDGRTVRTAPEIGLTMADAIAGAGLMAAQGCVLRPVDDGESLKSVG